MNTDKADLLHRDLTDRVIACFYEVYNELGHGFLEAVYENALAIRLTEIGLHVEQQKSLEVVYHGHIVGEYRTDILVNSLVLVEVKACSTLQPAHEAQVIHYLRGTGFKVGLLFNFGAKPAFSRLVF